MIDAASSDGDAFVATCESWRQMEWR